MSMELPGLGFTPSPYQQAIFDWVRNGEGHAVVDAVAGSGKTTTIVKALDFIPPDKHVLFIAFNRHIVRELKKRVPKHVTVTTFHGAGLRAWRSLAGARLDVDENKARRILKHLLDGDLVGQRTYIPVVLDLMAKARAHGLVPKAIQRAPGAIGRLDDERWGELIEHYDIEFDRRRPSQKDPRSRHNYVPAAERSVALDLAERALVLSIEWSHRVVDFADMTYLPVVMGASFPFFDWVFVDEAQDASVLDRELLIRLVGPDSRLCAVGDEFQSLYGFRAADPESMARISETFSAKHLPLSISYRCAKAIVAEAQKIVPHIQAADSAPDGSHERWGAWSAQSFRPTDAILCRKNAPLFELAYMLIGRGVGCRIVGREIGDALVALIGKMRATSLRHLEERLGEWEEREKERALKKGRPDRVELIEDKAHCIEVVIDSLPEDRRTIAALVESIEGLFSDKEGVVTLSSVHRAKGMEWDRVFILDRSEHMPSRWAKREWMMRQEMNIIYVAVTRARHTLVDFSMADIAL